MHYTQRQNKMSRSFFFYTQATHPLPGTDDTGNGDIDTGCVRRRLGKEVDVGTTKLLGESKAEQRTELAR